MPLSPPVTRRPYHFRQLDMCGYYRTDGLWDIEGSLRDTKSYSFPSEDRGEVKAGEPVHDMKLRLTVDDDFCIRAVEAKTDASPFSVCPGAEFAYQALVGMTLGPGVRKELQARLARTTSCTHLTELILPLATVAYQTIYASGKQARRDAGIEEDSNTSRKTKAMGDKDEKRPRQLDSCLALSATSPVVARYWPQYAVNAPKTEG